MLKNINGSKALDGFSIGILFLLTNLLLSVFCYADTPETAVVNGTLDLRCWDPQTLPIIPCSGLWRFQWNDAQPAYAAPDYDDSTWQTIAVPDAWQGQTGTAYGYGWYRLTIENNNRQHLGLYIKNSSTAYALYVNGELRAKMGLPGTTEAGSTPATVPQLVALPDAGRYVIAIFNSNFDDVNGGLTTAPQFGELTALNEMIKRAGILDAFILGIMFVFTLYFFIVWLLRKEDTGNLYFALLCLTSVLRMATFSYHFASLFPLNIFAPQMSFQFLSVPAGTLFLLLFLSALYKEEFKNKFYTSCKITALLLVLFAMLTPVGVFTRFMLLYQLIFLAAGLGITVSLVIATRRKKEGAAVLLTGFIILLLSIVNDFIGALLGSYDFGLEQYAFILLIVLQAAILAYRSARAFRTSEHLSQNLQAEITLQTQKIEHQNKELIQLNEERTNFFINFLHETKTPLTNIHNYLQRYLKRSEATEDTQIIKSNIEKLRRDLANFFDLEKLHKGFGYYDHSLLVDCSVFVKEKVKLFVETAATRRITITHEVEENIRLAIDPNALDRILNNLIDNAIRYNKPGGKISITFSRQGTRILFSVADTGRGIPEDQLEHIFKPYYQVSHTKQNLQGIGVGLSIVKKILDDLDARISVSSKTGEGTTMSILFAAPASVPNIAKTKLDDTRPTVPIALPVEPVLPAEAYRDDRFTILLVEDNRDTLLFLQQSLSTRYNVFTAVNGLKALRKIRTIPKPHLIISDIMMDEMDGYAFYDALTGQEDYADIPFIFLTARSTQEEKLSGFYKGAIHYIAKPFDIDEVIAAVESFLQFLKRKIEKEKQIIRKKVIGTFSTLPGMVNAHKQSQNVVLSEREKQITAFIMKGYQNKEISQCLEISTRTVDKHIENIYKKHNVQNRVELVRIMLNQPALEMVESG